MSEARVVIGDYRDEYNRVRPHGGLGDLSPAEWPYFGSWVGDTSAMEPFK